MDHGFNVKEDFVGFAELDVANAKTIADILIDKLKSMSGLKSPETTRSGQRWCQCDVRKCYLCAGTRQTIIPKIKIFDSLSQSSYLPCCC